MPEETEEIIDTPMSRVNRFWAWVAIITVNAVLVWAICDAFYKTALQ